MEPAIAVIVTTYNRCALLRRALDSLLAQTFRNWEAVVVDDGSTDETSALLDSYRSADSRVRSVYQKNAGLAAARNAGLAMAVAPLVTFLDSDDEYAPEHLASRVGFMERRPEVDLLYGGFALQGGPDWVADRERPGQRIALADCYLGGTFVIRRHVVEALGGFRPPDYGDDYDFMQRAIAGGFRVEKTELPTYLYYRDTPDGICNRVAREEGLCGSKSEQASDCGVSA